MTAQSDVVGTVPDVTAVAAQAALDSRPRPWCDTTDGVPPHGRVRQWLDEVTPGVSVPEWNGLPSGSVTPGVTVVIPAYLSVDLVSTSVESLMQQTLAAASYEVVVVLNGPDDGAADVLARMQETHEPGLLRVISLAGKGVSVARNAGLVAASRSHVTFVDADDQVTPGYLECLWTAARDGVVPVAEMRDVIPGRTEQFANYTTAAVVGARGHDVGIQQVPQVSSYNAAKLVPTRVARRIGYDETLVSGEDVVFMTTLLTHLRARLRVVGDEAIYLRTVLPDSLSRQFLAGQEELRRRLEVCRRLVTWQPHLDEDMSRVVDSKLRTQVRAVAVLAARQPTLQNVAWAEVAAMGLHHHWATGL